MDKIVAIILMCFVLASTYTISLYQHELNHTIINAKIGSKSHVEISDLCGFPVLATFQDTVPTRDLTVAELAHSFNESVNYNLNSLLIGVMLILIIGFIYSGEKKGS